MSDSTEMKYPLLQEVLADNLSLQPMYTNRDVARIFKVCVRAIQNWISTGKLVPRNLPGRWRFLSQDLEDFIKSSRRNRR